MKKLIIATLLFISYSLVAQSTMQTVLAEIEKNNTTLLSLRKRIEADKLENKIGLLPQNPEIEFNYLWGNPSAIGNRTDVMVRQNFDFPTSYIFKNQISNHKNEQVELEYKKQRNEIINNARMLCINLIYYNALKNELTRRNAIAFELVETFKTKFSTGDINIIDLNRVLQNHLNIKRDLEINTIESDALLSQLATLNGGIHITLEDSSFITPTIPLDFEQWYSEQEANNPVLKWIKQENIIAEKTIKLNTSNGLPKFYAGYMSENNAAQTFSGISLGITIPLWENRNNVQFAKAQHLAIQSVENDAKLQFYNSMKSLHAKSIQLQNMAIDYRNNTNLINNNTILLKAFNYGEISLSEYLYQLSEQNEIFLKMLEIEMKVQETIAELYKFQ